MSNVLNVKDAVEVLERGEVIYDCCNRAFIYKQVGTIIPSSVVPKMTSLPQEMKHIVSNYSKGLVFNKPQYNSYNPTTGEISTWCPNCGIWAEAYFITAKEFLNKQ